MPNYHCGQPVFDVCPLCGETGLALKFLIEQGKHVPEVEVEVEKSEVQEADEAPVTEAPKRKAGRPAKTEA
jgi:hypothetical protein